ncbi:8-oxo-dGTP diphosphatase [compost metagenome]
MAISEYYKKLREQVGSEVIFVPSVAAIIRNEHNEILFIRKGSETIWGLPAGAIEIGETPSESIVREVYEETGLSVQPEKIIGVFGGDKYKYVYSNGHQVEYLIIVFECTIVNGELHAIDDEVEEQRFFKNDDIPEIAIQYPSEMYMKELSKTLFE